MRGLFSFYIEQVYFAVYIQRILGVPVYRRCKVKDSRESLLLFLSDTFGQKNMFGDWVADFTGVATGTLINFTVDVRHMEQAKKAPFFAGIAI